MQTSFTADGEKEEQFNGSPPRPQPRGPRTPPGPPPPDDDEDEPMPVSGSQEEILFLLLSYLRGKTLHLSKITSLIYILTSKLGNQIHNAQKYIFGLTEFCILQCIQLSLCLMLTVNH